MGDTEVVSVVEEAWRTALPELRLPALKNLRRAIPPERRELFDSLVDAKISGVEEDPGAVVLFLVHGIQTDGAWQKSVQGEFKDIPKLNVFDIGYDCVTAAQLAGPFRSGPLNKVVRDIRDAKRREPRARLMIIAHSFGTYLVSQILKDSPDIEFERIVLCGSIVPRDFNWGLYARSMPRGSIVNDVGTKDSYPVLATCASVGYGASGRLGFKTNTVNDRYFCYGHSDFFVSDKMHIRSYWKPFIKDGTIIESPWDTQKPKTSLMVLLLSHPWIGRTLVGVPLILALLGLLKWAF
jgi:pimeloyl-ACP methyl ester carboxylesterase